jgi:hypothetical protein
VLIEADRLRQQLKKHRSQRRSAPVRLALANPGPVLRKVVLEQQVNSADDCGGEAIAAWA